MGAPEEKETSTQEEGVSERTSDTMVTATVDTVSSLKESPKILPVGGERNYKSEDYSKRKLGPLGSKLKGVMEAMQLYAAALPHPKLEDWAPTRISKQSVLQIFTHCYDKMPQGETTAYIVRRAARNERLSNVG